MQRRDLKKANNTTNGTEAYREVSKKKTRKGVRVGKEDWIQTQCTEIEVNLSLNNSKRAFQVMKYLTKQWQSSVNTVQGKQGDVSLKNKKLLVGGPNTAQNSTTTRSMETPAF